MHMPAGSVALSDAKSYQLELPAHARLSDKLVAVDCWRVNPVAGQEAQQEEGLLCFEIVIPFVLD